MKIAVDLGHGVAYDGGAVGYIKEETIINAVGALVVKKLKAMGHTVIETRPTSAYSTTDSLNQRAQKANNNKCDLFVCIHANAGGGRGTEVYTYGAKKVKQAVDVLNNIVALGFQNRGIQDGSRLYVIRHTDMTAMLIEVCFTDTKTDVDKYNAVGAGNISEAIVKGITGKATPTPAPTPAPASNKEFKVKVETSNLNIRQGAGIAFISVGFIPKGVYTITETKAANGHTWGKLKSGAGWIALEYTKRI